MTTIAAGSADNPPQPLLSLRSLVIFALAIICGIGAGILTILGGGKWPAAVIFGVGVFALAAKFFDWLSPGSRSSEVG